MNKIQMNGYKRISKQAARKVWNDESVNLALVPCKQVPGHMMGNTYHPSNETRAMQTLDEAIRNFAVYNCGPGRDVGMYPAFYIYEGN